LTLNDLDPLIDFFLIGACAIAAKKKFDNISWYRELPTESPDQIFPDQISFQQGSRLFVNLI
jgi:hypothetical protein